MHVNAVGRGDYSESSGFCFRIRRNIVENQVRTSSSEDNSWQEWMLAACGTVSSLDAFGGDYHRLQSKCMVRVLTFHFNRFRDEEAVAYNERERAPDETDGKYYIVE